MALVAELITKLKADTTGFTNKLDGAAAKLKKFGQRAAKAGAVIAASIGVASVGAFTALLNKINETADEIDILAKTASKFGTEIESIQKLQFAASLSGVDLKTVEQGMGRLVKSMSDAKRGVGEAKDAFKELGLSVEDLSKLSTDKQYIAISEAIKKVTDANRQAELSVQIFGRSGVEQLNLLRSDLTATGAEFDKFGAGLTGKQAKAVENYNDSVTKLSALFSAFRLQLTGQVADALRMIVEFIQEQIVAFGGLGAVANKAAQFMVKGLKSVVSIIQFVIDGVESISVSFKKAELSLLRFAQKFSELNFEIFGGEFNFERGQRIAELEKNLENRGTNAFFTQPLQQKLDNVLGTLEKQQQQGQKGKIDINVRADKGLKADIAESPEVRRAIDMFVIETMAKTAQAGG